jgi:hypothetical protein
VTIAAEFLALPLDLLDDFGTTATYVVPQDSATAAGVVTGTDTEYDGVDIFGPLGETKRDESTGATCTFVLPGATWAALLEVGDTLVPQAGHRIVLGDGRTFLVNAVERAVVAATTVAWTLACSEQPGAG